MRNDNAAWSAGSASMQARNSRDAIGNIKIAKRFRLFGDEMEP